MLKSLETIAPEKVGLARVFPLERDEIGQPAEFWLIRKVLGASVTIKLVGMLVVSLLGFGMLTVQYYVGQREVKKRVHEIQVVRMPQYKISQYALRRLNGYKISLLHLLSARDEMDPGELTRDLVANRERINELKQTLTVLRTGGMVQDVARISGETLDVFSVEPDTTGGRSRAMLQDLQAGIAALEEINTSFAEALLDGGETEVMAGSLDELLESLDNLYELLTDFAILANEKHNSMTRETMEILELSGRRLTILGLGLSAVLAVATMLYILIIVRPLRDILEKVKRIAKGEGDLNQRIEIRTQDEVGQLAHYLNRLVDNIHTLNSFKAVIEEEENTAEVNYRLATLLQDRYQFDYLLIYEIDDKNNARIAYASDPGKVCGNAEAMTDCNLCRAKRTGHPVSSLEYPEICKHFPHAASLEHYCIPMLAGGRVIGVVQILCRKTEDEALRAEFQDRLKRAARLVKEAVPVLEAKRFASALQETTLKDPMTNLYNRRFLENYVETLVAGTTRRKARIGILMCDMDFFKEVNDNYGHESGDMVIIKTAEILTNSVRAADMVIRFGGEEFLILLMDVQDRESTRELAEKIRRTMEETGFKIPSKILKKTMSIGFSEFPTDSEGFWEALKFADVALYRAKEQGRNQVVGFEPAMWTENGY